MTRPELLLGPGAVATTDGGLRLSIRQPWYRSLPLSSVVDLEAVSYTHLTLPTKA